MLNDDVDDYITEVQKTPPLPSTVDLNSTVFSRSSNSQDLSSRYVVIHTPAPFTVGGIIMTDNHFHILSAPRRGYDNHMTAQSEYAQEVRDTE